MLTRKEVVWAYRFLLGREPESEAVVESHRHIRSRATLRRMLLESPEFLANTANGFPDLWVVAEVLQKRRWMWVNLSDRHVSLGCMLDAYEPFESAVFARMVQSGDVVLDIGANLGWYTLIASTLIGDEGRVVCVEPRPETLMHLRKTIQLNGLDSQVTTVQAALSDSKGEAVLAWSKGTSNPGGSHLAQGTLGAGAESVTVPLLTLDGLNLDKCDVIKIDVEGAEHRVMKGGLAMLAKHQPVILSELHPAQLSRVSGATSEDYIALMAGAGYGCRLATPGGLGEALTGFPQNSVSEVVNVVFVPSARAETLERQLAAS